MVNTKADIIAKLQQDILLLQGFKPASGGAQDCGLGPVKYAFPNASFPLGCTHEFLCSGAEEASASSGFIAGIVASLMKKSGACIWISPSRMIFPPALANFGIAPDKIIFIDLKKEKERIWAMEEALRCNSVCAVIGEIDEISFIQSRRFQLATEQSRVTGFFLRRNPKNLATSCVARWKISPLQTAEENDFPGVGFPRWYVELLKVRNGKPGSWQMEWNTGTFRHVRQHTLILPQHQRKTG